MRLSRGASCVPGLVRSLRTLRAPQEQLLGPLLPTRPRGGDRVRDVTVGHGVTPGPLPGVHVRGACAVSPPAFACYGTEEGGLGWSGPLGRDQNEPLIHLFTCVSSPWAPGRSGGSVLPRPCEQALEPPGEFVPSAEAQAPLGTSSVSTWAWGYLRDKLNTWVGCVFVGGGCCALWLFGSYCGLNPQVQVASPPHL